MLNYTSCAIFFPPRTIIVLLNATSFRLEESVLVYLVEGVSESSCVCVFVRVCVCGGGGGGCVRCLRVHQQTHAHFYGFNPVPFERPHPLHYVHLDFDRSFTLCKFRKGSEYLNSTELYLQNLIFPKDSSCETGCETRTVQGKQLHILAYYDVTIMSLALHLRGNKFGSSFLVNELKEK